MDKNDGYKESFEKYGVDPRSLKWRSLKAAQQRYKEIISLVDFEGKSVLDVGCGFGDITKFITVRTSNFSYLGVDRMDEFIKVARKKHPRYRFVVTDYFKKPLSEKFDVVIANGCLNSNLDDNLKFRKRAIKTLFEHTKEFLIFNMAGTYPQLKTGKKSNIWFADALEIQKYCLTLSRETVFKNHPRRKEFTILMRR
ncbi:class I SAM-dependent methyltransferase [Patescibacteria group bacterium]